MTYANDMEKVVRDFCVAKTSDIKTTFKMDDRIINDALEAHDKSKKNQPAGLQPNIGRIIMKSPITKLAAAAVIVAAVMLSIHLWDKSTLSAYAFKETVEAMQGKRSFHIQTYFQQRRNDEFWAEFDEEGKLVCFRQEEGKDPNRIFVTTWKDGVKTQYYPPPWGVKLMTRVDNLENLEGFDEGFDPETIVQEVHKLVACGRAVMEIQDPPRYARLMTIHVKRIDSTPLRQVLVVDPVTKFVVRIDDYWDRGENVYHHGIEVLEYNETIDPRLFDPNLPEDTLIMDQVTQEVGMAQGDMSNEEVAVEICRQALEAWAKGDFAKAGKLCGGAPRHMLAEAYAHVRPVRIISIGQPEKIHIATPRFWVPCQYEIERDGQLEITNQKFAALTVNGRPGRWYVNIIHTR
ncbi:MAG: hypothetical protein GWN67_01225 [Phycisphaerae bacterium]|nr:hypothetical protein [Phycisphaerae bacterium]NIP50579.1 hypothetical protein [Phycisphaerae bacterium]NIS50790.1 hypothetical protein [Phycisphaerae bacterium]NIU07467.1 hypothetical protein [Phycisphaerae bacterium]NIU55057.1 hypothetical protein [Phycisphaerae bacterium]